MNVTRPEHLWVWMAYCHTARLKPNWTPPRHYRLSDGCTCDPCLAHTFRVEIAWQAILKEG